MLKEQKMKNEDDHRVKISVDFKKKQIRYSWLNNYSTVGKYEENIPFVVQTDEMNQDNWETWRKKLTLQDIPNTV